MSQITIHLSCAMCGREKHVIVDADDHIAESDSLELILQLAAQKPGYDPASGKTRRQWVIQYNGQFDTYCGKECAK